MHSPRNNAHAAGRSSGAPHCFTTDADSWLHGEQGTHANTRAHSHTFWQRRVHGHGDAGVLLGAAQAAHNARHPRAWRYVPQHGKNASCACNCVWCGEGTYQASQSMANAARAQHRFSRLTM